MVYLTSDKDQKYVYCEDGIIRINKKFDPISNIIDDEIYQIEYIRINKITDENIIQDVYDGKINIYIDSD